MPVGIGHAARGRRQARGDVVRQLGAVMRQADQERRGAAMQREGFHCAIVRSRVSGAALHADSRARTRIAQGLARGRNTSGCASTGVDRRARTARRAAAAAAAAGRGLHGLHRVAETAQPRRVRRPFDPGRDARLRAPARGRQQATRRIPRAPRDDERDDQRPAGSRRSSCERASRSGTSAATRRTQARTDSPP